ncbi:MAG: UbiA family prenyltransferase [Halobacteriaceae archaeon]
MSVLPEATAAETVVTDGARRAGDAGRAFVRSPVFPGALAVSKGVVSLTLLSAALNPVLFAIGFLVAVTVYTHNRLTDLGEDAVNRPDAAAMAARRKRLLGALAGGSYVAALGLAALGGLVAVAVVLLPGVAAAAYSEPWLPVTGYDRLKEVPVVNTVVTAGAWALPLGYLPVAFAGTAAGLAPALVATFLFLRTAGASEVLNARDVDGDREAGVVTVPIALGVARTRHVLYAVDAAAALTLTVGVAAGALPTAVALGLLPGLAYSVLLTRRLGRTDPDVLAVAKDGEYGVFAAGALAAGLFL